MRNFTMTGPTRTAARWAGEAIGERLILAKLDPQKFSEGALGTVETAAGRVVVSGTLVGRSYADRDAGVGYGPYAPGAEQFGLIAWEVNLAYTNDAEIVPPGVIIKENRLPDWETADAAKKAVIRATYVATTAVN